MKENGERDNMKLEALPITDEMIREEIRYNKVEFNKTTTYDELKLNLRSFVTRAVCFIVTAGHVHFLENARCKLPNF